MIPMFLILDNSLILAIIYLLELKARNYVAITRVIQGKNGKNNVFKNNNGTIYRRSKHTFFILC